MFRKRVKCDGVNQLYSSELKWDVKAYYKTQDIDRRLALLKVLVKDKLGFELHDVQLNTVLGLCEDKFIEMKTGEGKTVCITLAAILSVTKEGPPKDTETPEVVITTTSTYLAERDVKDMRPIYGALGVTVSWNPELEGNEAEKLEAYKAHVMYSECSELCFDYLRDRDNEVPAIWLNFKEVIVDEADFVLSDNALTNCSVSGGGPYEKPEDIDIESVFMMTMFYSLIDELSFVTVNDREHATYEDWDVDYVVMAKDMDVYITAKGVETFDYQLGVNISDDPRNNYLATSVLKAYNCYLPGRDYAVSEGKIGVINQSNGRAYMNSQFEADLQNAIEIKHDLAVTPTHSTTNTISYQVFFSKFKRFKGVSGTLEDIKQELWGIFKKEVELTPTNAPVIRKDCITRYFKHKSEKFDYVKKLLNLNKSNGNPKLVIFDNEGDLHRFSKDIDLPHNVLTNLDTSNEQEIVDVAGEKNMITLSTSLMGRGTDIKVGEDVGLELHCTSHFRNMRVDNQVRGRSGRQGNPGITYFYSSLGDDVWKQASPSQRKRISALTPFNSKRIQRALNKERKGLQSAIYSLEYTQRKQQFVMSSIDEDIHKYWNQIITNMTAKELTELAIKPYNIADFIVEEEEITRHYNEGKAFKLPKKDKGRMFYEEYLEIKLALENLESTVVYKTGSYQELEKYYVLYSKDILTYHLRKLGALS